MAELTRLVNHVSLVGFFINDLGALGTPLLYAFREREKILDLFEQASGARMMCNYFRFGGLRNDVPEGWLERAAKVVDHFPIVPRRVRTASLRKRNHPQPHAGCGQLAARTGHQRRRHRPHAPRQRHGVRFAQGGSIRNLRPLQVSRALHRWRHGRLLRPLHDSHARDAREHRDFETSARRHSRRRNHGQRAPRV